jgi:hypothetical protein
MSGNNYLDRSISKIVDCKLRGDIHEYKQRLHSVSQQDPYYANEAQKRGKTIKQLIDEEICQKTEIIKSVAPKTRSEFEKFLVKYQKSPHNNHCRIEIRE